MHPVAQIIQVVDEKLYLSGVNKRDGNIGM